jgi:hypothetical protein
VFPPPISISLRSGFFLERLVWVGCVAVIRRMNFVESRCSLIFWSMFSVSGFSGSLIVRWSSFGGSFIHASVSCFMPYGVLL